MDSTTSPQARACDDDMEQVWRDAGVSAFEAVEVGYSDDELDRLTGELARLGSMDPDERRGYVEALLDGTLRMAALHWLDDTDESDGR